MHQIGVVMTLPAHRGVLVLAETPEVERFSIYEEFGAADLDGPDSEALAVVIEHLAVGASLEQPGFEAVVTVVEPTGSETHLVAEAGGRALTAVSRDRLAVRPGDRVRLNPDPARAHLNRIIVGTADPAADVRRRRGELHTRTNSGWGVEVLLTASPGWWRGASADGHVGGGAVGFRIEPAAR